MRKRVLVFPCDSEIGLEIHNALRWEKHIILYGGTSVRNDHGSFVYKRIIEDIPFIDSKNFIKKLNEAIEKYKIDAIYPAHDSVVLKLSKYRTKVLCKIITGPYKTNEIARSKKKTYTYFFNKLPVPKIFLRNDKEIKFPLFLKPEVGQGSKGVHIANSQKELEVFTKRDKSLLLLEYLPGREFTVDCFTDINGKLLFVGGRERKKIVNGISVNTNPIVNAEFNNFAEIINSELKMQGAWFFQLKEDSKGKLVLMEFANRIAGSMGLYRGLGVNFPLLSIYNSFDIPVDVMINQFQIVMDRTLFSRFKTSLKYKCVYIDLDDLLILNNKINPMVVLFLFQAINNNKKIILLTKHKKDLTKTLKSFRIDNIFDKVIHIEKNMEKVKYIKEPESIFIDDSFSERKSVASQLHIPTFDLSSIESLIDWRY